MNACKLSARVSAIFEAACSAWSLDRLATVPVYSPTAFSLAPTEFAVKRAQSKCAVLAKATLAMPPYADVQSMMLVRKLVPLEERLVGHKAARTSPNLPPTITITPPAGSQRRPAVLVIHRGDVSVGRWVRVCAWVDEGWGGCCHRAAIAPARIKSAPWRHAQECSS